MVSTTLSDVELWVLGTALEDLLNPVPGMPSPSEREVEVALALHDRLGLEAVKYPDEWSD